MLGRDLPVVVEGRTGLPQRILRRLSASENGKRRETLAVGRPVKPREIVGSMVQTVVQWGTTARSAD